MRKLTLEVVDEYFDEVGVSDYALLRVTTKHKRKVGARFLLLLAVHDALCNDLIAKTVDTAAGTSRAMTTTLTLLLAGVVVLTTTSEER